ncbi:restriction endonuclease [Xanthomonas campestris pv. raphani]|nr:restriction endonuclease [Xanthomonas campestris]MEA9786393.1 restriction endonuclease [Xanthomonas campestris pv. raphani]
MGSRRGSTEFTVVRPLSWPLGFAVGVSAFFAIRTGGPWLSSQQSGLISQGFNQGISAAFAPIAWMLLSMCWLAALASFIASYQHRKLLDTLTSLESLAANGWRQFELLAGEAFRRRGYTVEETGLGGGGIDLILPVELACATPARRVKPNFLQGLSAVSSAPGCARCGKALVERKERRKGENFSGYIQLLRYRGIT